MELSAEKRELNGKKVKRLRLEGLIPAVLYSTKSSRGEKSVQDLAINLGDFKKVFKESGSSALIDLHINGGETINVLIHEVQFHPVTLEPIHAGLYEVNMSEKIDTEVPINVIKEDENEKVKAGEGIILTVLSNVNVRSLPKDIPHEFEVDASELKEVGDVITIADLKYDKNKVEILDDLEEVIAKLDFAQQLETKEEGPTSAADVEVIKEKDAKDEPHADKKDEDS